MPTYEGHLDAAGLRFGIVVSRFNETITRLLLDGALTGLRKLGAADENVHVAWVPGAFEIPVVAKRLADSGACDAVLCLGAVIRGATAHFDLVAGHSAAGVARAAFESSVPVIFGILTTDSIEQAVERSGTKAGNKGYDAAMAAVEMVDLLRQLPGREHQSARSR